MPISLSEASCHSERSEESRKLSAISSQLSAYNLLPTGEILSAFGGLRMTYHINA